MGCRWVPKLAFRPPWRGPGPGAEPGRRRVTGHEGHVASQVDRLADPDEYPSSPAIPLEPLPVSQPLSRRAFLGATGATVAGTALVRPDAAIAAPAVILPPPARPVAISSNNSLAPVSKAVELMLQGA